MTWLFVVCSTEGTAKSSVLRCVDLSLDVRPEVGVDEDDGDPKG